MENLRFRKINSLFRVHHEMNNVDDLVISEQKQIKGALMGLHHVSGIDWQHWQMLMRLNLSLEYVYFLNLHSPKINRKKSFV